jgi:hypothetical protein
MNAVVQFQPQQQPVSQQFTMSDMERVALAIAKGGLFGSTDPNAVLTLCMVAQAEGKHPGLVMQQYHIISGKPAKKAEAMLVDFLASGGRVEWHQLDDECADATFTHPAGGSARITWDKARVAQAQLGGNAMHKKYPRQMLRSRVVSEGVRTVFPGATSGMYVPEEIADFDNTPARSTPAVPQAQRARDITPKPQPEPEQFALTDGAKPQGRAKAEEWADEYIAALTDALDMQEVEAIRAKGVKALTKLQGAHSDLYAKIIAADPHSDLAPTPADDADGNLSSDEGGSLDQPDLMEQN